jgi:hypothetical protein
MRLFVHVRMLHELTHNTFGPHDAKFYGLLDKLKTEYMDLVTNGFRGSGFEGPGQNLGGAKRIIDLAEARRVAAEAAEKRGKYSKIMVPVGGRRLGGSSENDLEKVGLMTLLQVLLPGELALMAAERRLKDEKWCGQNHEEAGGNIKAVASSSKDKAVDRTPVPDPPGKSWECGICTFVNEPLHLVCIICNVGTVEAKPLPESDVIDLTGD